MAVCQVRTWWEKDVKEDPWALVENTGCSLTLLRKILISGDVDGRKNERWEVSVGLNMADSKLPGSVSAVGVEGGSSFSSLSSCSVSVA